MQQEIGLMEAANDSSDPFEAVPVPQESKQDPNGDNIPDRVIQPLIRTA
jgi:hypothetical protein